MATDAKQDNTINRMTFCIFKLWIDMLIFYDCLTTYYATKFVPLANCQLHVRRDRSGQAMFVPFQAPVPRVAVLLKHDRALMTWQYALSGQPSFNGLSKNGHYNQGSQRH